MSFYKEYFVVTSALITHSRQLQNNQLYYNNRTANVEGEKRNREINTRNIKQTLNLHLSRHCNYVLLTQVSSLWQTTCHAQLFSNSLGKSAQIVDRYKIKIARALAKYVQNKQSFPSMQLMAEFQLLVYVCVCEREREREYVQNVYAK